MRSASHGSLLRLSRVEWPLLAKQILLIYGLALAIALPWYGRNARLYGNFDLLGLARHNAVVVGQLRTADFLAEVGWRTYLNNFITTTFHSFWGQFGWMAVPMSERVYLALTLLMLTALGGIVGYVMWDMGYEKDVSKFHASAHRRPWSGPPVGRGPVRSLPLGGISGQPPLGTYQALCTTQCQALALMALTVGLMGLGYLWYNLEFVQFQGRYLFPALIPLGLFFSLGLQEALSPRWAWWLAGGLALALGWLMVASLLSGDLDKWAVLITGLLLGLAAARAWLAPRWLVPASWLMAACYAGLALLTLVSPFWYVVPYLSR